MSPIHESGALYFLNMLTHQGKAGREGDVEPISQMGKSEAKSKRSSAPAGQW